MNTLCKIPHSYLLITHENTLAVYSGMKLNLFHNEEAYNRYHCFELYHYKWCIPIDFPKCKIFRLSLIRLLFPTGCPNESHTFTSCEHSTLPWHFRRKFTALLIYTHLSLSVFLCALIAFLPSFLSWHLFCIYYLFLRSHLHISNFNILFDSKLSFQPHITSMRKTGCNQLFHIFSLSPCLFPAKTSLMIFLFSSLIKYVSHCLPIIFPACFITSVYICFGSYKTHDSKLSFKHLNPSMALLIRVSSSCPTTSVKPVSHQFSILVCSTHHIFHNCWTCLYLSWHSPLEFFLKSFKAKKIYCVLKCFCV